MLMVLNIRDFIENYGKNRHNEFDTFPVKQKVNHIIVHNQMLYHLKRTIRRNEMIERWLASSIARIIGIHLFSKL